jgi:hypothetical protein
VFILLTRECLCAKRLPFAINHSEGGALNFKRSERPVGMLEMEMEILKKILLLLALFVSVPSAFGQGTFPVSVVSSAGTRCVFP